MNLSLENLPDLLRRIGTSQPDLRAVQREIQYEIRRCRRTIFRLMGGPQARHRAINAFWMRQLRARRHAQGLRGDGKPYTRTWTYRGGLSKDHTAYMQFWRAQKGDS